ncbi:CAP domain-containing protein [Archangium sp.]|uniref:CAP domain-containing protein n=1 Tax=Archangium sp. TaxID=1872627 RepID=UPI002D662F51|nr:CAP domain-containing protein [Archangium sp.]HYO58230.1 CAP domain-containing protein [Archangium sp.]
MTPTKFHLLALSLTSLAAGTAGCGTSEAASKPGAKTQASASLAAEMVAAHNEARAKTKPTPKPALPKLTWSPEAAKVAQSWANECRFEHNKNRGKYGENLAAAAPPGSKTNAQAVEDWVSEVADYSYSKNKCAPGKMCGHYTQVVWRNTTQVGCATAICTKNSPFGAQFPKWQLWVCNYTPPGNYVGQKPY